MAEELALPSRALMLFSALSRLLLKAEEPFKLIVVAYTISPTFNQALARGSCDQ
jgi:hypothetical protein